ncbi:MAG: FAD-dependent oxidoreductase [Actinobacteria bacterium]|nr:MAG: FAD-dependent oxidoreductase [Actinomycetota bacterium]
MPGVVVIGGGVAGLTSALALSRQGWEVTVLEREASAGPADLEGAFSRWSRRGVPQARHSHAFLARLRNLLRDRAPDVLAALLDNGVTELRFTENPPPEIDDPGPRPGDEDLVALACRRTTFDWVLRRCVEASPGVSLVPGAAVEGLAGVPGTRGRVPRVTGVRALAADAGRGRDASLELPAELVVDASGRNSRLPSWLAELGVSGWAEESEDCGILYSSRFYRLLDGVEPPPQDGPIGGDLGYMKYAVFPGDNRTFSVTFGLPTGDSAMRPLLQPGPFQAAASALPVTRAWVDGVTAVPITDVAAMTKLRSRMRRLVVGGLPVVTGVVPVGDAAVHTNPLYGRGCSLAVAHAFAVADVAGAGNPASEAAAVALDHIIASDLEPWYRVSVAQDLQERAAWERDHGDRDSLGTLLGGDAPPAEDLMRSIVRDGLLPAARTDAVVLRAFLRGLNLLSSPTAFMEDPDVAARVLAVWQERDTRPAAAVEGPTKDEFLGILAAAA